MIDLPPKTIFVAPAMRALRDTLLPVSVSMYVDLSYVIAGSNAPMMTHYPHCRYYGGLVLRGINKNQLALDVTRPVDLTDDDKDLDNIDLSSKVTLLPNQACHRPAPNQQPSMHQRQRARAP